MSGNLVPRVSRLTTPWGERGETLVESGHVSLRIWETLGARLRVGVSPCLDHVPTMPGKLKTSFSL